MRFVLVLSIAGLSLAAGALVERAKADQAFLCEGGRIAYARGTADLERLKATDPCVAGYFGQPTLRTTTRPPVEAAPTPHAGNASAASVRSAPIASAADAVAAADPAPVRILNGRPGTSMWRPGAD